MKRTMGQLACELSIPRIGYIKAGLDTPPPRIIMPLHGTSYGDAHEFAERVVGCFVKGHI